MTSEITLTVDIEPFQKTADEIVAKRELLKAASGESDERFEEFFNRLIDLAKNPADLCRFESRTTLGAGVVFILQPSDALADLLAAMRAIEL